MSDNDPDIDSLREIYLNAVRITDPEQREEYLREQCAHDSWLLASVQRLIAADEPNLRRIAGTTQLPHGDGSCGVIETSWSDFMQLDSEMVLGPYTLIEQIGEGGMGVVFRAAQRSPVHREVAVKVLKPGVGGKSVAARFEAERQALAILDHANIAKVFDGGTTSDGRPYFVMELVRGEPITEFCDNHRLTIADRLCLFDEVCAAVQHAHQRGIIHRDLKPSNVLVESVDGRVQPKVIDFGVAKALTGPLTDSTLVTVCTQVIGTPLYMSPEQADASFRDIDTRSDVYSLGALLYELLTGQKLFDPQLLKDVSLDELRRLIREQEPLHPEARLKTLPPEVQEGIADKRSTSLSLLKRVLGGELQWIVMKALEKDRARRYDSPIALVTDLENLRNHHVVSARPPSLAYQLTKLGRRHLGALVASVMVALALVIGTIVSLWQANQATHARSLADERLQEALDAQMQLKQSQQAADAARRSTNRMLYLADMSVASRAMIDNDISRVVSLLERHVPGDGETDLRGFEWYYLHRMLDRRADIRQNLGYQIHQLCYSPDDAYFAAATEKRCVAVFDSLSQQQLASMVVAGGVNDCAWSVDGQSIYGACDDGHIYGWKIDQEMASFKQRSNGVAAAAVGLIADLLEDAPFRVKAHADQVTGIAMLPDGKRLVSCGEDGKVAIWNTETGELEQELRRSGAGMGDVQVTPDGRYVFAGGRDFTLSAWELPAGKLIHEWKPFVGRVTAIAVSADSRFVAAGGIYGMLLLADMKARRMSSERRPDGIESLVFLPDSQRVAVGDRGGVIAISSIQSSADKDPQLLSEFASRWKAHQSRIHAMAVSPKQATLLSGGRNGEVASWNLDISKRYRELPASWEVGFGVGLDVLSIERSALRVDDNAIGVLESKEFECEWLYMSATADCTRVALIGREACVVYDYALRQEVARWSHEHEPHGVAISPDGRCVAMIWWDQRQFAELRNVDHPDDVTLLPARQCETLAFSPDSKRLAVSFQDDAIIYDVESHQRLARLVGHDSTLRDLAFHPTDNVIATVGYDRRLILWDAECGELRQAVEAHPRRAVRVQFSNNGRLIATTGRDNVIRLWHVDTMQPVLDIPTRHLAERVLFAPDDRQLLVRLETDDVFMLDVQ